MGTLAEVLEQETDQTNEIVRYVNILEAWPVLDQYDEFPGWMKCSSQALWDL